MNPIQWEISVPIFRNRFILKDLAVAIGIPFGILLLVIFIISKGDVFGSDAKYAFGIIGMLFILTSLLIMVLYGGKYAPGFIVDEEGVINYTQMKQAKKNKAINFFLMAFGIVNGKYTIAGAGMLAQSKQVVKIKWKSVRKVKYYPKQNTIMIRGGFAEKIAVFCLKENYEEVSSMICKKTIKYLEK